jgi:hypothetical protein
MLYRMAGTHFWWRFARELPIGRSPIVFGVVLVVSSASLVLPNGSFESESVYPRSSRPGESRWNIAAQALPAPLLGVAERIKALIHPS